MKVLGESFKIFATEEDARKWFREFDKDWERLMKEAMALLQKGRKAEFPVRF